MPASSVLLALTCLSASPAHAADVAQVQDTLARFRSMASTTFPPIGPKEAQALADGEVVTLMVRREDGHQQVVALAVNQVSKEAMWLATQDHHFTGDDEAIEANVSLAPHHSAWYGMLDIPRPFSDRHWVIDVWDNVELAHQTGGAFWEHPWKLRSGGTGLLRERVARGEVAGLDLETFEAAVETPVNEGALVFLDLHSGESLFAYSVTSSVGGAIPERLVAGFVRATMEGHVRALQERAAEVIPTHYVAGHAPVLGVGAGNVPYYR